MTVSASSAKPQNKRKLDHKPVSKKPEAKAVPAAALPEVGSIVSGVVKASGAHGVFVTLSPSSVIGRVQLRDIATRFISGVEVAKLFPTGRRVEDLIVSGVAEGKVELKLKTRVGDPTVGSIHKAVVKRVEKYGVLMGFPNSLMRCLCVTEEVDDDPHQCKTRLDSIQPGHKYSVKVLKVDQGKIWVTMKKSQLGASAEPVYDQAVMEFVDPSAADLPATRPTLIDDDEEAPAKATPASARNVDDVLEGDASGDDAPVVSTNKKTRRIREAEKLQRESVLREKELAVASGDWKHAPETPDEFERLILLTGTQHADAWIKYMSYWLKMAEANKAREIAERAIKQASLSFSDEQEKYNLWIAYLNMEAAFGASPNAADQLFVRAAQFCDAKRIHHALPQVYVRAGLFEKAQTAFERVVGKFPHSRKAWVNLVEFYFAQGREAEARATFAKAAKSVPKHKLVRLTVKMGQFEFRNGHPDRGTSIFEQLLQKIGVGKTDVWSVLIDETIKAHTPPVAGAVDAEPVRALFERALSTKLKPFKMKFFFKRWLEFETKHGSDQGVETVKNRAVAYVESLPSA